MLARLGQVLYWVCCGIAVLMLLYGLLGFTYLNMQDAIFGSVIPAIIVALIFWLAGRAARYILAGK